MAQLPRRAQNLQEALRSAIGGEHLIQVIQYNIRSLVTGLEPVYNETDRNPVEALYQPLTKERVTALSAALTHQMKLLDKVLPTQKALEVTDATDYSEMTPRERSARLKRLVDLAEARANGVTH